MNRDTWKVCTKAFFKRGDTESLSAETSALTSPYLACSSMYALMSCSASFSSRNSVETTSVSANTYKTCSVFGAVPRPFQPRVQ